MITRAPIEDTYKKYLADRARYSIKDAKTSLSA